MTAPPVACVTGASSGIGAAIATELASTGYAVVLHGFSNLQGLQRTAARIQARNSAVRVITADLREKIARRGFVQAATAWRGRIDAWVNNAGADILTGGRWDQPFDEKLFQLWSTDVMGTIDLSRLVSEFMMRQQAGPSAANANLPSIVNIGWDQAHRGMAGEAGELFGTIKSAIEGFTWSLAQSVAPRIRVNLVAPGWIKTAWGEEASGTGWDERARTESLLQRWGTPQDVAATVAWLVSDHAAFIHGQRIEVNGGRRSGLPIGKPE